MWYYRLWYISRGPFGWLCSLICLLPLEPTIKNELPLTDQWLIFVGAVFYIYFMICWWFFVVVLFVFYIQSFSSRQNLFTISTNQIWYVWCTIHCVTSTWNAWDINEFFILFKQFVLLSADMCRWFKSQIHNLFLSKCFAMNSKSGQSNLQKNR